MGPMQVQNPFVPDPQNPFQGWLVAPGPHETPVGTFWRGSHSVLFCPQLTPRHCG